jgi:hypothetical protein
MPTIDLENSYLLDYPPADKKKDWDDSSVEKICDFLNKKISKRSEFLENDLLELIERNLRKNKKPKSIDIDTCKLCLLPKNHFIDPRKFDKQMYLCFKHEGPLHEYIERLIDVSGQLKDFVATCVDEKLLTSEEGEISLCRKCSKLVIGLKCKCGSEDLWTFTTYSFPKIIFKIWKQKGRFLEGMCYHALKGSNKVHTGVRLCKIGKKWEERDVYIANKRAIILCATNPSGQGEAQQAKSCKEAGLHTIVVTTAENAGRMGEGCKVFKSICADSNFPKLLVDYVSELPDSR